MLLDFFKRQQTDTNELAYLRDQVKSLQQIIRDLEAAVLTLHRINRLQQTMIWKARQDCIVPDEVQETIDEIVNRGEGLERV